MTDHRLTYRDSGVDIAAGEALIDRIRPDAASTARPGAIEGLGGFGALFDPRAAGFEDPILVAATDGVGTKLRIAIDTGMLDLVGIDLVAMCVNDLICRGAEPLFFLDYFATGKLSPEEGASVVAGIAAGCRQASCALIGGETAELPGMYAPGDFDLAGFAVGAIERGRDLPRDVAKGDMLVGIASSGVHSNGYSLVRRIVADLGLGWTAPAPFMEETALGAALLEPTRIYVPLVLPLVREGIVKGLAHVTGGGLTENVPRILPDGLGAAIDLDAWELPGIFRWLITRSDIADAEALRTFNCGIGMVLAIPSSARTDVERAFEDAGEQPIFLGEIVTGRGVSYRGDLT